jgi:hypothetical protein
VVVELFGVILAIHMVVVVGAQVIPHMVVEDQAAGVKAELVRLV